MKRIWGGRGLVGKSGGEKVGVETGKVKTGEWKRERSSGRMVGVERRTDSHLVKDLTRESWTSNG